MASTQPQTPIQIHIPPSLRQHAVPLATFLTINPRYVSLAVGSIIFYPPFSMTPTATNPRLLLVQRAATEHGFPNRWEVPGGGAELTDPTILHSTARETFEETGLRLTSFVRKIGPDVEFDIRLGKCLKLIFEIEVAEINENYQRKHKAIKGDAASNEHPAGGPEDEHEEADDLVGLQDVPITLDPKEHQDYVWATEKDIRESKYPITTPRMLETMLQAFILRRAEADGLRLD